jgi:hypothetical protein
MSLIICNGKKAKILEQVRTFANTWTLRAYKNDYTPLPTSVVGDFTEATYPGYAAVSLNFPNPAFLNGSNKGQFTADTITFLYSGTPGSQDVYGVYVTDDLDGSLVGGARDPAAPVTISDTDPAYSVTIVVTDDNA